MISENYILGTLMKGRKELKTIALNSVKAHQFDGGLNRQIFEACKSAEKKFGSINKMTAGQVMREEAEEFDFLYLDEYDDTVCKTVKEIEGHCREVSDSHTKRSIIDGLQSIVFNEGEYESSGGVLTDAENVLSGMKSEVGMPGLTYSQMMERDANQRRYEELTLNDPFWDKTFFKNCGCHKGQMTTLFGDSKHGKSMAAMMYARKAIDAGYAGLYTSFEDIDRKYAEHVRRGLKDKDKIDNLIVTDHAQGCSTLDDIVATTKYHKAISDISFLVVDNAQIVGVDGVNAWDETQKLVTISPRLSRLAIELDIWVLLLSQISNERSKRSGYDRQPKIHDIYGSGQIRKDSYMAMSVFKPSEVDELLIKNEYTGEVRGVKHPNGSGEMWPTTTVLIRQELVREGEKYWKNVILDISDDGLFRPAENEIESVTSSF